MRVMLLVDASGSGVFGSREQAKREVAAEIAALLAFSAIKNNDRIGLIIFTDRVERFVPPKKGKKHVLALITEILTFQPQSKRTDLRVGLEFLGKVARRRSVAFLVSDFIVDGGTAAYEKAMRIAKRKHDLGPAADDPDAPTVGASLDKSEAHVGDRLILTVSAVAKAGIAVTLPQKLDLGKLEVLDRNDGDRNGRDLGDGRRSHRFVLSVAAYETGDLELPAIPLSYLTPRREGRTLATHALPPTHPP